MRDISSHANKFSHARKIGFGPVGAARHKQEHTVLNYLKKKITTRVEVSLEILEKVYFDRGKAQEFTRKYGDLFE